MSITPIPQRHEPSARPRRLREPEERHRRYGRWAKVLLWRAALGAAYAMGTGMVTIAVHWIMTSV
ncbi:hypothetical protein ACIRQQ_38745 [Streptomyces fuscichromogenes]|uniref:hypothetical protein n=1 Tax=Streptomyces fuscichromogenes TaxID=1324013 RepID=UPI0038010E4F